MSETTVDPSATAGGTPDAVAVTSPEVPTEPPAATPPLTIPSLLAAGIHFGHQTRRWNPKMRPCLFGERNGIHIIDLDQTLPMFKEALDFIRETTAEGGTVLFVGTKRQAASSVMLAAQRSRQFYVNNRWLGGMLTNWKTVKKSIDRYKTVLETLADEERVAELSKKELARQNRLRQKYEKSLAGIKEMSRLPDVMFVVDVGIEAIAVSEAKRLGITIVGVVDSNNDPGSVDFVVPGNDDAIRAIDFYCAHVADACIEGDALHQEKLRSEAPAEQSKEAVAGGRRVVEIKQAPRRSRSTSGRTASAGGWSEKEAPAAAPAPEAAAPAPEAAAAAPEAAAPAPEAAAPAPEAAAAAPGGAVPAPEA
ncbi:MAG: 30S ribosomal protein S2, partial [Myxococcota bacterium]|nr:30S ribosomal protein S2 [Myxococcota bacterium]